ncbi:MAG: response regulator, partial [Proteobacteria bacterium]
MERTLLIVDDEEDICEILGELAKPLATKILFAHDGSEALVILKNHHAQPIDAVISDINMPVMNGLQLLAFARELE